MKGGEKGRCRRERVIEFESERERKYLECRDSVDLHVLCGVVGVSLMCFCLHLLLSLRRHTHSLRLIILFILRVALGIVTSSHFSSLTL